MKVILLKDIRGVGQHHDIKNVADGYAVNFLFPQKLAEPATDEKMRELDARKKAHEEEIHKTEAQLDKKIELLHGKQVRISARATEKGGLFKGVGEKDVAKAILAEHSLEIPEGAIALSAPIKTVGEHPVMLSGVHQKAELIAVVSAV